MIKAVFSDKINNKIVMDEFCFEAEILARLSHPNICKAVGRSLALLSSYPLVSLCLILLTRLAIVPTANSHPYFSRMLQ